MGANTDESHSLVGKLFFLITSKFWLEDCHKCNVKSQQINSFYHHFNNSVISIRSQQHVEINKRFYSKHILKVSSAAFLLVCFSILKESTCETWKNVFILLRKLFSFSRNSNFRYSDFITSSNV